MLEVRREFSVLGDRSPAVVEDLDVREAGVYHRFYGDDKAGFDAFSRPCLSVVMDLGIFMHAPADAVPDEDCNH